MMSFLIVRYFGHAVFKGGFVQLFPLDITGYKGTIKRGFNQKKVLFIMIESYHGNYGTISIWKFFPLYHN
jgi:hypothetical protein